MYKYINILQVGIGPNADRVYLPVIKKLHQQYPVNLKAVVDLEDEIEPVRTRLTKNGFQPSELAEYYTDGQLINHRLTKKDIDNLNDLVKLNEINAVIISTEPQAHKAYALWALDNNLPILMDKPITARTGTSNDVQEARSLYGDYNDLLQAYKKSSCPIFSISVQRRYHPGFQLVNKKISEIRDKFNIPITSIQSTHADGQWRLPSEVINQKYHPYNIYGKLSHSGYHFVDVIAGLISSNFSFGSDFKQLDKLGVYTSFVKPRGLLHQLSQENYAQIFGTEYVKSSPLSDQELYDIYRDYAEVDVTSIIKLMSSDDVVANISLNLLHNSFARRSWLPPGTDLYKGNGRVKHEYHNIEQGPFQNIQIHSYQKNDKHEECSEEDFELGGNNHFDIYVFRNSKITGDKEPLEKYSMRDLLSTSSSNQYAHDQVRYRVVREFVEFLLGKIDRDKLVSSFETHELSALLMSLIYQAGALNHEVVHDLTP